MLLSADGTRVIRSQEFPTLLHDLAVDVREIGGTRRAVFAGTGMIEGMYMNNATPYEVRDKGAGKDDPIDGFFVVLAEK